MFSYQCSFLLLSFHATAFILYQSVSCLSTTFLFLFCCLSQQQLLYITIYVTACQQLFQLIFQSCPTVFRGGPLIYHYFLNLSREFVPFFYTIFNFISAPLNVLIFSVFLYILWLIKKSLFTDVSIPSQRFVLIIYIKGTIISFYSIECPG